MTLGDEAPTLERRLHELDAEIDLVRRRIYAVQKGLHPTPDPERELAALDDRFRQLGDEFVEVYRRWQAAERLLEAD